MGETGRSCSGRWQGLYNPLYPPFLRGIFFEAEASSGVCYLPSILFFKSNRAKATGSGGAQLAFCAKLRAALL